MNDITQKLRLIFGVEGEEKANTQVKSLDKSIMGLAKNIGLAAIAYKAFTTALDIGKKSLQNYNEQIIAMRQIETTLRSTGQAVNWTTQELANMASELQNVSKFGDDEILKGATQSLLRFDGISKEIFPRVQALTVDMAESMGSLDNAAKTLGISLADPLLGLTRLRRVGVMFNETQEATIKGFVESGKKIEAQRVLLDALEGKYKGLALVSVTASEQMKIAWNDYLDTVGGSLSFLEGIKMTITQYLILMTKESDAFTEGEINNASEVQMAWGNATAALIVSGKGLATLISDLVKISGGAITLVVTLVSQGVLAIDFELKKLVSKCLQTIMKIIDTISALPPAVLSVLGGDDLKNAFGTIADIWSKSADTKKVNPYLQKLKSDSKEISKIIADNVKDLGNIPKSVVQTYSTLTWEVRKRINELNELSKKGIDTSALQKMLEDYEKGLGDTGDNLKQILITNEEAMRDYYEIIAKYLQDWIDSQLKQYRIEIDAKYSTVLTKQQIDNMYYAKERELQKEAFDYFQNIEKDKADKMRDYYEIIAKYSQDWIDSQLKQYRIEIDAKYSTVLTKQQIDNIYYAKEKELQKEAFDYFQNIEKDKADKMRDYYEIISKYSQDWIDSQLKQYKIEIDAKYSTVLAKEQIDNMYYAKERELQKEAYDYFQNIEKDKADKMKERYEVELAETQKFWEAYQKYIETSRDIELQVTTDRNRYIDLRIQKIQEEYDEYVKQGINSVLLDKWRADQIKKIYSEIPDNIKNLSDIVQENMSNISSSITNILGNTIYDFISGTKSMKDAWKNAWEAMAEITMRIISQIIAQMIELFFWQKLVGLATGGIGGAGTIPSIAPGAFEISPAPIASTGRNNLNNINTNNQQNELMMSIDGLKREIASSGIGGAGTIPYELMMSIDGLKREIATGGIGGAGTIPSIAPKIIADSVKDLGNIPKSVEQTYSTITWEVRKRINELNELSKKGIDTSALQKMLDDFEKGLGDTGDNLKQILITNEEAMRDYYEIIAKYSQDWIDSQLKQYKIEIDAKYSTVLTKQQIDNMYYAKERELQKEAYDYFQNIEGAFEIPPAPIASTGRNNLSTININNQQNELMMSIDGLKREIASSREQNFNLYLDGLPLRNAIKRVEKNLNIMGS